MASVALAAPAVAVDATRASQAGAAKIEGRASTLQSGRIIAITRGVNLDGTDWEGKTLKGVAFQQSVMRKCNFKKTNLFSASFFDADLAGTSFEDASMRQVNLEMADLTDADLTGADLTELRGAGHPNLKKIENTDWTDVDMRKDQRSYLRHRQGQERPDRRRHPSPHGPTSATKRRRLRRAPDARAGGDACREGRGPTDSRPARGVPRARP